jgi:hypothetical protein
MEVIVMARSDDKDIRMMMVMAAMQASGGGPLAPDL